MTAVEDPLHDYVAKYSNIFKDNNISDNWKGLLAEVFNDSLESLEKLNIFLETIPEENVLPKHANIWSFTQHCKPEEVKVVIIGQDPYPTPDWAHGLAFSVEENLQIVPPSLQNIFKEVKSDIQSSKYSKTLKPFPKDYGNLERWAKQGVLLLNSVLTVTINKPKSHAKQGWENVIENIIKQLQILVNKNEKCLIFLLWGREANNMDQFVNKEQENRVLSAGHPSPLNRLRNFEGCRHFSRTNDILTSLGQQPIDWSIVDN